MAELSLYIPEINDLWFRQKMMADPATMSYNANWDVDYEGYHRDTGCIDFPREWWENWHAEWIGVEPERFYAYIQRKADGEWLGEVCFHHTPEKNWWDMGIILYAPHRGNGYAAPALCLLAERAFSRDVNCLHNDFELARNEVSAWQAHLSAGFRDAGTVDGFRHMRLTREDYLKTKEQST